MYRCGENLTKLTRLIFNKNTLNTLVTLITVIVFFTNCVFIYLYNSYFNEFVRLHRNPDVFNIKNVTTMNYSKMNSSTTKYTTNSTMNSSRTNISLRTIERLELRVFDYNECINTKTEYNKVTFSHYNSSTIAELSRFNCSHFVTLDTKPDGRLGNKLFQIASLIAIAKTNGYTPILRTVRARDPVLVNYFEKMIHRLDENLINTKMSVEKNCCRYNENVRHLSSSFNWTMRGFYQSWRYFKDSEHDMRRAFTFRANITDQVEKYMSTIRKDKVVNIGIHVRRGDFLTKKVSRLGYTTVPVSYLNQAITYYSNTYERVQFIFASDDLKWCRKFFGRRKNAYFSPFTDYILDFALIASCDHTVITSGSFSWWAGWLAGGTTVYYSGFPKPGTWLSSLFNLTDYYPPQWIGMQ